MVAVVRWWFGSSLLGLLVSSGLLALAIRDETVRRQAGVNGAMRITTQASVVLKAQLCAYFALSLVAAATTQRLWRVRVLIAGNLVLVSVVLYRLKVRRDTIRWSRRRP